MAATGSIQKIWQGPQNIFEDNVKYVSTKQKTNKCEIIQSSNEEGSETVKKS